MPLTKINDEKPPCMHPEHNPPTHYVYTPGTYEYTCPGCGEKTRFTVNGVYCTIKPMIATPAFKKSPLRRLL